MINLTTPLSEGDLKKLKPGDMVYLSGDIYAGRDAVLPKIVALCETNSLPNYIDLQGGVVFHTAVSPAGIGPTSSNKVEIEESIIPLSKHGIRLHLGKGMIKEETVKRLGTEGSVFAVIPPVTALLKQRTKETQLVAYPELGMEALYKLKVENYPCIIAAANGGSIFDD